MEISIADVANDWCEHLVLDNVTLRFGDAFGEPRQRHAYVGGECLRAGAQPDDCPVGVVARLPEFRPLLSVGRPGEGPPTEIGRDFPKALRLLLHPRFGAMKF